jgi:hypothetical protein
MMWSTYSIKLAELPGYHVATATHFLVDLLRFVPGAILKWDHRTSVDGSPYATNIVSKHGGAFRCHTVHTVARSSCMQARSCYRGMLIWHSVTCEMTWTTCDANILASFLLWKGGQWNLACGHFSTWIWNYTCYFIMMWYSIYIQKIISMFFFFQFRW